MRAAIIGGGKGCKALIELTHGTFLKELELDVLCVVDPDTNAPGMVFARELGIKTSSKMEDVLLIPDIEVIIELTGRSNVLEDIYKIIPSGIEVIDHTIARIFWDLANAQKDQARQLKEIMELEQNIEKERFFLQSLFDKIPELVVVMDRHKKIIKINTSFSTFTGFTPEQAKNNSCLEMFAGTELNENCRKTIYVLDEVIRTGQLRTIIWRSPPPNETFWEVTHTPILDKDGKTSEVLSTWHKITEKVLLQRRIQSAELMFKSFIDSANDWISVKDLDGRYLIVNKITAQSFNLQPEDFIGKKPDEILPEEIGKLVLDHDREVLEDDFYHIYNEIVPVDERDQHFQTVRFPLKDYKGSTIGVCTIMRNVTSEKNLSDQLIQSEKLAAIGKLAAGVAHEINNPLTGILAFAEDMVDDLPENDNHQSDLRVIIRETLRCRDIVRNLLDFARQENPKLEKLDPNTVVDQALSLVVKLPQFRNITIKKDLYLSAPSIQGDPHQLQQVILNFMLNSAEAMKEKGVIIISTSYNRRHDKYIISVEDDGPGIPENLIDKIFEPFFSTKGTNGLGLAVSWGIIERHHGIIEVDKTKSGGALFRIILPVFREK